MYSPLVFKTLFLTCLLTTFNPEDIDIRSLSTVFLTALKLKGQAYISIYAKETRPSYSYSLKENCFVFKHSSVYVSVTGFLQRQYAYFCLLSICFYYWLFDWFFDMSTVRLFYAKKIGNCVHCSFIFTFLCSFLRVIFTYGPIEWVKFLNST